MIENVVEKLLGFSDPSTVPRKFAKWVGIYLETMTIDPQLCACINDSQCASELDTMILELLELEDYEPQIDLEDVNKVLKVCRDSLG